MDQRVGTEHRQHIHVLLRMMQLVEAPEHSDAMVREMDKPVQTVHGDDDDGDRTPPRERADPGQDDPRETRSNHLHEGESECSHQWGDEYHVHAR